MAQAGDEERPYEPKGGILPPLPSPERGYPLVTSTSPDGKWLLYGFGPHVVVRSIEDPTLVTLYSEHTEPVKVAKFAPNGSWVASGDTSGKMRVWAWNREDHLLKKEHTVAAGEVEDLAWDGESKRILTVGGGREKARVVVWDTGSNVSQISPMHKLMLTGDMKPQRPFRAVFSGEDSRVAFCKGPPFKNEHFEFHHTNFVNCIRYSPDGERFVSVSSDKLMLVYDGKTGEKVGELPQEHTGSVFSCAWSPDGGRLATVSADKTVRVWDMERLSCVGVTTVGSGVQDMQASVVWPQPNQLLTVSLSGDINYIEPCAEAPSRTVSGHKRPVTAMAGVPGRQALITADADGAVCLWVAEEGSTDRFSARRVAGQGHDVLVRSVQAAGGQFASLGLDNKLRIGSLETLSYEKEADVEPGVVQLVVAEQNPSVRVVLCRGHLLVFRDTERTHEEALPFQGQCVALARDGATLVVGGDDKKGHFFSLDAAAGTLTRLGETARECAAAVCSAAFSPDGATVALGDATREVALFAAAEPFSVVRYGDWRPHGSRVTGVTWLPDGEHVVSVGIDRQLCVFHKDSWKVKQKHERLHSAGIMGLATTTEDSVWIMGEDGTVRQIPIRL